MGMILTEAQRPHIGEFHYRRALEISGVGDPILLANLAWNLKCQGRIAEAREFLPDTTVLAIADGMPGLPPALDKPARPEPVNAWLCRGVNCLLPISDLVDLRRTLKEKP